MARRPDATATRRRQRGWAGLVALLLALLIVAWLGRTLLARLLPAPAAVETSKGHAGGRATGGDATAATPVPRSELERAKGLEAQVRKDAADEEKRIDAATQ
jgi:hypothetical protein